MKLSVSQVKTFTGSQAKWAGKYILWIQDEFKSDALLLGNLYEHYLIHWEDNWDIAENKTIHNPEKLAEDYEWLKHNGQHIDVPKGSYQTKVEGKLLWQEWVGYIDLLTDDTIIDIKTVYRPTKTDSKTKNMWSGLTSYEEYELQMWVYMSLTWYKQADIIEIAKFQYKDWRQSNQIIHFERSDDRNYSMTERREPVVENMAHIRAKHK